MFFTSALLLAGAGLAVAQSISSQCSGALIAIATSPQATCLDLTLLAPLVLSNNTNTSIVPTVGTWLNGLCSQGPCSNATLQAVVTNVTTACANDLTSLGLTTNGASASTLTPIVEAAYPAVRQIACLKDTATNTLCPVELLNGIQSSSSTPLSINSIEAVLALFISGSSTNNITIPQNVACSNCSQAAYSIVSQEFPSLLTSDKSAIQSECGSAFTSGQMPSGIQETASNSSSTSSTSGAAPLAVNSLNVGVAMLVAVSSAFTIFA